MTTHTSTFQGEHLVLSLPESRESYFSGYPRIVIVLDMNYIWNDRVRTYFLEVSRSQFRLLKHFFASLSKIYSKSVLLKMVLKERMAIFPPFDPYLVLARRILLKSGSKYIRMIQTIVDLRKLPSPICRTPANLSRTISQYHLKRNFN